MAANVQTDFEEIKIAINEIKRRQDNLDNRLIALEQQQLINASSSLNVNESLSTEKTNRDVALENLTKEENKRSTCFMCRARDEKCTLYFDDLYDFDKKQINTNIGADVTRTRCPCGHLIRIHERNPNSSETNLPSFATPPLGQLLYEEIIPPFV